MTPTRRSVGSFAFLLAGALLPAPLALLHGQATPAASSELSDEQRDIREILADLRGKMDSLARKLEATQPEEAKRLKEAAEKIRANRVEDLLEQIGGLLKNASFIEAIGRQDRAITEIDALIQILERSRFDTESLGKKLAALAEALRETSKLAKAQETQLQKTREFREGSKAIEDMGRLKGEISELKEKQSGLNQGADPAKLDEAGARADEEELSKAASLLKSLLEKQAAIRERIGGLPSGDVPVAEKRELAGRLDELIEKAEEIVSGTEAVSEVSREIARREGRPVGAKKEAGAKGEPGDPSAGAEGAKEASRDEKGTASKEAPGGEGGKKTAGDAQGEAAGKEEAGKESAGKESGGAKEFGTAKESGGARETRPDEPREGPSDLERARAAEALREAREGLGKSAENLSGSLEKLSGELGAKGGSKSKDAGARVQPNVQRAAAGAKEAAKELAKGDLERGLAGGKEALKALKEARRELGAELQGLEERNASETAGPSQEQGLLEQQANEGSRSLEEAARKGSSEAARSALSKGSEGMSEASKSMKSAAESLGEGSRSSARQSAGKAEEQLKKALDAVEAGRKEAAARSAEAQRNDLQKKLARKAEETRKKIEELRKKLQKKKEPGTGEKLSGAESALGEASRAMDEAAEAGRKGDSALAKKKGEEALQRLDEAARKVEEEEKDELARLERRNLKKEAKEQEELARLTRNVQKKLSSEAKGEEGAEERAQGLGEAAQNMDRASEGLEKEDTEGAEKNQEEALAKLRNAQEELEEEEERLAKLQREQEMLSMVAELTETRDAQLKINAETTRLHSGRQESEGRKQRLRLQQAVEKLVGSQGELAEKVDGLTGKLKEEVARVFAFILRGVSADMRQVRDSLKELETGTYTQFLQTEIVGDLERLLTALKEELAKKDEPQEQQPGQQQTQEGRRRLVPYVAELRMLKGMQLDVNRGTRDLEDVRKAADGKVTEGWEKALDRLLQKQGSVSRMTQEIQKDFEKALRGEEGEEEGNGGEVQQKDE